QSFKLIPAHGVYAVRVRVQGTIAFGMLYIGTKPTLTGQLRQVIEVNILDFERDIYGEVLQIDFLRYIRGDMKFGSLEELTDQISRDKTSTIDILKQYSK
ncbi:MAG: riboflavin kinase, partial [Bacteroidota bacterium]